MGSGVFAGMPLALAGTRKILELMDWGEELNHRISLGAVGTTPMVDLRKLVLLFFWFPR